MKTILILSIIFSVALASCTVTEPGNQAYADDRYERPLYSTYDPFYSPYNDPYAYGATNRYNNNGRYYSRPAYTRPVYVWPAPVHNHYYQQRGHHNSRNEHRHNTRQNTTPSQNLFGIKKSK